MAVLEMSELPGRESMIDWAFFWGSSAGTFEANRGAVRLAVMEGRLRVTRAGRTRVAP
jgi:hypothetical protein